MENTHSNRREWMTAAAGGMLIGTSKAWAGANDRMRVALIGAGGRGGALMREMWEVPNVSVVAVAEPDRNRLAKRAGEVEAKEGKAPRTETDLRKILEDPSIDAVTIATCNHWHTLAAIWAMQAGKHVYVEKPVCHNFFEGQKLAEASRKYNRVVQGGTQRRSVGRIRRAMQLLNDGAIGQVFMSRNLVTRYRKPIGFKNPETPPSWLDWDVWLGPAPSQDYHANLIHYNWHWFWDFGNGEMGNNGVHYIDVARWGMNQKLPVRVQSTGGRFGDKDQAQTPNVQNAQFTYADGSILECEIRNVYSTETSHFHFYGTKGYMYFVEDWRKQEFDYKIYLGDTEKPEPDGGTAEPLHHYGNFVAAVKAGKPEMAVCNAEEARLSSSHCMLADISYRLKRDLRFDPKAERFVGDSEADRMLTHGYRKGFEVPDRV
ncbi:MAG: Gfo/Idh/MocA family protein [Bryobacteraceae bacterium]